LFFDTSTVNVMGVPGSVLVAPPVAPLLLVVPPVALLVTPPLPTVPPLPDEPPSPDDPPVVPFDPPEPPLLPPCPAFVAGSPAHPLRSTGKAAKARQMLSRLVIHVLRRGRGRGAYFGSCAKSVDRRIFQSPGYRKI
jgi:hypothetical protein